MVPALLLLLAPAAATPVTGRYWAGPEEHRLVTRTDNFFVAGPAAAELDRLLAKATPPRRAWTATVTACGVPSAAGRYGHMGRHRRQLSLTKLLRVVTPNGRMLLDRPGTRC